MTRLRPQLAAAQLAGLAGVLSTPKQNCFSVVFISNYAREQFIGVDTGKEFLKMCAGTAVLRSTVSTSGGPYFSLVSKFDFHSS